MIEEKLGEMDLYLFHKGDSTKAYKFLGAHFEEQNGKRGVRFSVWAPNAQAVSVVGDFNNWDTRVNAMTKAQDGQIWTLFIPGIKEGAAYKYAIVPPHGGPHMLKADPYGCSAEVRPQTASKVYDMNHYEWNDQDWMDKKNDGQSYDRPMLIYEVHAGSWKRTLDGESLNYRDLADSLIEYVKDMNYSHIEFMPLCEHPFDGSWGYQATGYYAVTSRFGDPDDFRYLVDKAHQAGIGIIMDWVPGHFCKDDQGLRTFDGVNLYESDNTQLSDNVGWGTLNFDYGRTEVQSFLISNAMFWMEEYHMDGLRIDAVANMLYLNYGREEGQWTPNKHGGSGNLEAMDFIKKLNDSIFKEHPHALMIAEESTSWPMISRPIYMGGLGFNYKWNMGWMNDILRYMSLDPIYRKWHQDKITFSMMYAFSENFVLPLSHDEVVHGKCSLINKMPGDYWQKFAGLRAFFGYWMSHPGKKLLFMGGEFGQFIEWNENDSLDWHLVEQYEMHTKMQDYSRELNKFYLDSKELWQIDFDWNGFRWIDCHDSDHSMVTFMRRADDGSFLLVVCNFTPEVHRGYNLGVPVAGSYEEVFNSDSARFGGSNVLNEGELISYPYPRNDMPHHIVITVPPLSTCYYRLKEAAQTEDAAHGENSAAKEPKKQEKKKIDNSTGEDNKEVKASVTKPESVSAVKMDDKDAVEPEKTKKKTVRRKKADDDLALIKSAMKKAEAKPKKKKA